jgi:hypothetical protein
MTIQIQKPELEALILERMQAGAFSTVEEALLQALKSSPSPLRLGAVAIEGTPGRTGADLIAAMQASPYKEIALEPMRNRLPVREVAF